MTNLQKRYVGLDVYKHYSTRLFGFVSTDRSDVLINEDWVAVGIHHHKTCGARRTLVCLAH